MPRARSTTVTGSPALAAETVICTLPGQAITLGAIVDLFAAVDITIGTSGVTATFKIERGAAAGGTVVSTMGPFTVVAANRYNFAVIGTDTQAGEEQGQQYVLTATIGSGAATSTVNNVCLTATWGALGTAYS